VPAKEGQTLNAGFPADFQDPRSQAMDKAIGIEKASLATVVGLNSAVVDIYKDAFGYAPVFGELFDTTAKSFALCIELQMNWLTMMVPHPNERSETSLHVAAPSSTVASSSGGQAEPQAEELAHSMDIAIRARDTTQSNAVASNSGSQAQLSAEVPELSVGITMGARAA
jgi:hypothetical protein